MKDYLFVSFFLGHTAGAEAKRLLRDCDLLEIAESAPANRHAWLGGLHRGVSLRLPADDGRLGRLLDQLTARQVDPLTRLDREFSQQELDRAEWLMVRVATAGLYGGVDYRQEYDLAAACVTCGTGAAPMPPLVAQLGSMGKKDIDHLVYEGHLIVSERVAEGLKDLSGAELLPVQSPRRPPDSRFRWLKIEASLPRMHPSTTGYAVESPCPTCGRAGHYGAAMQAETPKYHDLSGSVADFNLTWEYFGNWQQHRSEFHVRPVGGSRGIVVSQKVRQTLTSLKVRRLVWIPVEVISVGTSGSKAPPGATMSRG